MQTHQHRLVQWHCVAPRECIRAPTAARSWWAFFCAASELARRMHAVLRRTAGPPEGLFSPRRVLATCACFATVVLRGLLVGEIVPRFTGVRAEEPVSLGWVSRRYLRDSVYNKAIEPGTYIDPHACTF